MFGQKSGTSWFFDSSVHVECVSRLLFVVENREPIGWLTGADGSGRTLVLSQLRNELQRSGAVATLLNVGGMNDETALCALAGELGLTLRSNARHADILQRIADELRGRAHCGSASVLLVDDVHRSVSGCRDFLNLMLALRSQCDELLTVIAATDEGGAARLASESLIRVCLESLDDAEASDFVRATLRRQGVRGMAVDESAVRAISMNAGGRPSQLHRLCRLLQVVHEATPDQLLTDAVVRAIQLELAPRAA